jgi:hypothetical protein
MIDCIARKIPRLKECDISTGRGRSARRAERDSSGGQAIFLIRSMPSKPLGIAPRTGNRRRSCQLCGRGARSSIFLMPRMSERGRTRYAGLGRCWLTSGGNGRLPRLEANGLLAEPGRSPRCGLFARCAGVHVDFHAHRYFDNLRSFPGHSFLPSILGAMWRRSEG